MKQQEECSQKIIERINRNSEKAANSIKQLNENANQTIANYEKIESSMSRIIRDGLRPKQKLYSE